MQSKRRNLYEWLTRPHLKDISPFRKNSSTVRSIHNNDADAYDRLYNRLHQSLTNRMTKVKAMRINQGRADPSPETLDKHKLNLNTTVLEDEQARMDRLHQSLTLIHQVALYLADEKPTKLSDSLQHDESGATADKVPDQIQSPIWQHNLKTNNTRQRDTKRYQPVASPSPCHTPIPRRRLYPRDAPAPPPSSAQGQLSLDWTADASIWSSSTPVPNVFTRKLLEAAKYKETARIPPPKNLKRLLEEDDDEDSLINFRSTKIQKSKHHTDKQPQNFFTEIKSASNRSSPIPTYSLPLSKDLKSKHGSYMPNNLKRQLYDDGDEDSLIHYRSTKIQKSKRYTDKQPQNLFIELKSASECSSPIPTSSPNSFNELKSRHGSRLLHDLDAYKFV